MGNYVIAVGNYLIAKFSQLGNYKIADRASRMPDGGRTQELLAKATDWWNAGCAMPRPPAGSKFPSDDTFASVRPEIRERVREVLGCLEEPARKPGQAMVAISVAMLAGAPPRPRRAVRMPVVLADLRAPESKGVTGTLELREFPAGPAGLFPDPSAMRIVRTDDQFDHGLRLAWDSATGGGKQGKCVLWRLILDDDVPDFAVDGGSLGTAFAILLWELLVGGPASGPAALAKPRGFFERLRPRCAVTGVLSVRCPAVYSVKAGHASETVSHPQLWLDAVGGMDAKLQAAKVRNWRLIAPKANESDSTRAHESVKVHWATTVRQADKYARRYRPIRTAVACLAVLTLVGVSTGAVLAAQGAAAIEQGTAAIKQARAQKAAALSDRLVNLAIANLDTHLDIAQLLAVEAARIDNTPQARSALFQAATASPNAARFLQVGAEITALGTAANGRTVVAGTSNGLLVRFDLTTGRRSEVKAGSSAIKNVAVSAGGAVVVADSGSQAITWHQGQAVVAVKLRGTPLSVAVSPSGEMGAFLSLADVGAPYGSVAILTIRNLQAGTQISDFDTRADSASQIGFPSASTVTVTSDPGAYQEYSVPEGRVISYGLQEIAPADGGLTYGISPDARISGYIKDGEIAAWLTSDESDLKGIAAGNGPVAPSYITFSNDDKYALSLDGGTITISPLSRSASGQAHGQGQAIHLTPSAGTSAVTFLGGDYRLASAAGTSVELWNLRKTVQIGSPTGISVPGFQAQVGPVALVISPDDRYLAMIDDNATPTSNPDVAVQTVFVYRNGRRLTPVGIWHLKGQQKGIPVWAGDRLLLIGNRVRVYTTNGRLLHSWPAPSAQMTYEASPEDISPTQVLIPVGADIESLDPETGTSSSRPVRLSAIPHFARSYKSKYTEAISPDGAGAIIQAFHGRYTNSSSSLIYADLRTGAAHLIESGLIDSVLLARSRLFVQLSSGQVQEWNRTGRRVLGTLPGSGQPNSGLTVSPDDDLLGQVNGDGVATVTDLQTGQIIVTVNLPTPETGAPDFWDVTTLALSPGDRYMFSATPGGTLIRWDIGESDLIKLACDRAGGRLTPRIWAQYVHTKPPPNLSC